ncbi:MAG: phosphatase [Ignavibacteriae bacterium]|nr:MAG: phosphatase [Ignavibacteriota bacterium]
MNFTYEHIIWDWNGTILDDVDLCLEIGNNLFSKYNLNTITKEKYKAIFTIPIKDYYKSAGFDFSKYSFEKIGKEWMNVYEKRKYECKLSKNLLDTLQKFSSLGIEQSILSAYKHDYLTEMVRKFNIDSYFKNIVGVDNIYAESKIELGKKLIENLGNCNALLIGDTVHDFDVAKEIGVESILISGGHQSIEKLKNTGTKVYNSLNEFYSKNFE